jgi:hypothetical protein
MKKEGDTLKIKIKDLINHLNKPEVCNTDRTLNYYPDFLGTDNYVYIFKFDKPITLLDDNLNTNVKNSFGEYIFQLEQIDEVSIKLSSHYSIYKELVTIDEFQEVCSIYQSIEEQASKSLKVLK